MKQTEHDYIASWFKDHKATYTKIDDNFELLVWSKPEDSTYKITYIRHFGTLMVYGDLYEAIYRWSGNNELAWIARCEPSYFAGKCCASQYGRSNRSWDKEAGKESLKEVIATGLEDMDEDQKKRFKDKYEYEFESLEGAIHDQWEWFRVMENLDEDFSETIFGCEKYTYYDIGMTTDITCKAHLIGLQLAIEQLNMFKGDR